MITAEQLEAHRAALRLESQACEGYTDPVLAALVFIILGCPPITMADLAGFEGPDLWKLAVIAHRKRLHVIEALPSTIPLSRGEWFAVTHGLAKQRPELPTAKDVLGLVKAIYGEPMFRAWTAIVYPHAHALTTTG